MTVPLVRERHSVRWVCPPRSSVSFLAPSLARLRALLSRRHLRISKLLLSRLPALEPRAACWLLKQRPLKLLGSVARKVMLLCLEQRCRAIRPVCHGSCRSDVGAQMLGLGTHRCRLALLHCDRLLMLLLLLLLLQPRVMDQVRKQLHQTELT
jgi:hypothetical protein